MKVFVKKYFLIFSLLSSPLMLGMSVSPDEQPQCDDTAVVERSDIRSLLPGGIRTACLSPHGKYVVAVSCSIWYKDGHRHFNQYLQLFDTTTKEALFPEVLQNIENYTFFEGEKYLAVIRGYWARSKGCKKIKRRVLQVFDLERDQEVLSVEDLPCRKVPTGVLHHCFDSWFLKKTENVHTCFIPGKRYMLLEVTTDKDSRSDTDEHRGCEDCELQLFDLEHGTRKWCHDLEDVNNYKLSSDGCFLAVHDMDNDFSLCYAETHEEVYSASDVYRYAFSHDDQHIAVLFKNFNLEIVHLGTGEKKCGMVNVHSYLYSPGSSYVAVRFKDGKLGFIKLETGQVRLVSDEYAGPEYRFSKDGKFFMFSSQTEFGKKIHILDVRTGKETLQVEQVYACRLSSDGNLFAVIDNNGCLALFETQTGVKRWEQRLSVHGKPVETFASFSNAHITNFSFNPHETLLAVKFRNDGLQLYDCRKGILTMIPSVVNIQKCTFSPDDESFFVWRKGFSGGYDALQFFDFENDAAWGKALNNVHSYCFSPDKEFLAVLCNNGRFGLYDRATGEFFDLEGVLHICEYAFEQEKNRLTVLFEPEKNQFVINTYALPGGECITTMVYEDFLQPREQNISDESSEEGTDSEEEVDLDEGVIVPQAERRAAAQKQKLLAEREKRDRMLAAAATGDEKLKNLMKEVFEEAVDNLSAKRSEADESAEKTGRGCLFQ